MAALAETTTNLLHSILDFLHCHAVLDIIKQRELLGTALWVRAQWHGR